VGGSKSQGAGFPAGGSGKKPKKRRGKKKTGGDDGKKKGKNGFCRGKNPVPVGQYVRVTHPKPARGREFAGSMGGKKAHLEKKKKGKRGVS